MVERHLRNIVAQVPFNFAKNQEQGRFQPLPFQIGHEARRLLMYVLYKYIILLLFLGDIYYEDTGENYHGHIQ